ncbi:hypothetical protein DFH09DRAFT_1371310 [Mycena vulgaris]|nr:hypothetical protein DFH09DRAFT_1371310 [Mycena vulgaris]
MHTAHSKERVARCAQPVAPFHKILSIYHPIPTASYSPLCDAYYARHALHGCTSHSPRSLDPPCAPPLPRSAPFPSPFSLSAQSLLRRGARVIFTTLRPVFSLSYSAVPPVQRCPRRRDPARPMFSCPNAALTPPSGPPLSCTCCAGIAPCRTRSCAPTFPVRPDPIRRNVRPGVRLPFSVRRTRYPSHSDPHPHIFSISIALVAINPIRLMFLDISPFALALALVRAASILIVVSSRTLV